MVLAVSLGLSFIPSRVPLSDEGCRVHFGQMGEVPGCDHSHGLVDPRNEKEVPDKQSKPNHPRLQVDQMNAPLATAHQKNLQNLTVSS